MASIPGSVRMGGFVAPSDDTDTYAVQDEFYNRGGYRTVADLVERDAITADRRKLGMLVFVMDTQQLFTLLNGIDNADWVLSVIGGSLELTYDELMVYKDNWQLIPGAAYKITDFQTKHWNSATAADVVVGNVEPIIVTAVSSHEFALQAYSTVYPGDVISYDCDRDKIEGAEVYGWMEDGADGGDAATISNITANSFDVAAELSLGKQFYVYIEDSSEAREYYYHDLGVLVVVTDLGGGNYRLTFDGAVDLTDPSYNYGEVSDSESLGPRTGFITRRKDTIRNLERGFDFRAMRFRRWALDLAAMAYSAGITYTGRQIVSSGNEMYISIQDGNIGHPITSTSWWRLITSDASELYICASDNPLYLMGGNYAVDTTKYKDFYAFSHLNPTTGDVTDLSSYEEIVIANMTSTIDDGVIDNNVCYQRQETPALYIERVHFGSFCLKNTLAGTIKDVVFEAGNGNNIAFDNSSMESVSLGAGASYNTFCYGGAIKSRIDSNSNYNLFRSFTGSHLKTFSQQNIFYGMTDCVLGDSSSFNMFIPAIVSSTFGRQTRYNSFIGSAPCYSNVLGESFDGNTITGSFSRNTIGPDCQDNFFYGTFTDNVISGGFDNNTVNVGADFRQNALIGPDCSGNTFNGLMSENVTIGYGFAGNTVRQFSRNTVGPRFQLNTVESLNNSAVGSYCSNNTVGGAIEGCTIGYNFVGNTIPGNFRYNIDRNGSVNAIDFTGATHVYAAYYCELVKRSDGVVRLQYIDGTDTTVTVAPTA